MTFQSKCDIILLEKGKENPKHQKGIIMYGNNDSHEKTLEWASNKYDEYKKKAIANNLKWSTQTLNDATVVTTVEKEGDSKYSGHYGKAYCKRGDTYINYVGIAIAFARYMNERIPDYVLHDKTYLKDLKLGEMFRIKRTKEEYVLYKVDGNKYAFTNIRTGKRAVSYFSNEEVERKILR